MLRGWSLVLFRSHHTLAAGSSAEGEGKMTSLLPSPLVPTGETTSAGHSTPQRHHVQKQGGLSCPWVVWNLGLCVL